MVFPRARVAVSALLFVGWLIYLACLVALARNPIVVSRPQIMVANLCVLAKIDAQDGRPAPQVTITKVLWAAEDATPLEHQAIELDELPDLGPAQGWAGTDIYLLPLTRIREDKAARVALTPLPAMPGFHPTLSAELMDAGKSPELAARHIQKALGISAKRAEKLTKAAPCLLQRFLPRETAFTLKLDLEKLGAEVRLREYETRIYRATDEVLRQFHELKPAP